MYFNIISDSNNCRGTAPPVLFTHKIPLYKRTGTNHFLHTYIVTNLFMIFLNLILVNRKHYADREHDYVNQNCRIEVLFRLELSKLFEIPNVAELR